METTVVYWDYIGMMEKKMETTIVHRLNKLSCARQTWAGDMELGVIPLEPAMVTEQSEPIESLSTPVYPCGTFYCRLNAKASA